MPTTTISYNCVVIAVVIFHQHEQVEDNGVVLLMPLVSENFNDLAPS